MGGERGRGLGDGREKSIIKEIRGLGNDRVFFFLSVLRNMRNNYDI